MIGRCDINKIARKRTLRYIPVTVYSDAREWEEMMNKLTPAERVARLVTEFGWTETEAWNFLEELIDEE